MRPTRKRIGSVVFAVLCSLVLFACGEQSANLDSSEAVNIRIDNQTGSDLDSVRLGRGDYYISPTTRFVDIAAGETSAYLTVPAERQDYIGVELEFDGDSVSSQTEFADVIEAQGDLVAGTFYTFTIEVSAEGDVLLSNLAVDEAPA